MASFSYQIIPFSFLFIILIIYLATKTPPPKKKIVNKLASDFEISRPFLEDAENKLVALRDLYKQELIDAEIYIRKTDDIANSITKKIGAGLQDVAFEKKNQIYNQLKFDIVNKVKKDTVSKKSSNLDSLIIAVDKRIEQGFENEKG